MIIILYDNKCKAKIVSYLGKTLILVKSCVANTINVLIASMSKQHM